MRTLPLSHQSQVFEKIKDKKTFALFMEYGTGKTYSVLQYIEHNKDKLFGGVLFVGKHINVVEGGAVSEEIKLHTDFSYAVITGTSKQRLNIINRTPRPTIHLIGYDLLPTMFYDLCNHKYSMIVFDESTAVKNPNALRSRFARKLADTIEYRAILTGFPVSEHLDEIWSQFYIIDRGKTLGASYWKFMTKYFYKWRFGWTIKKNMDKKIMTAITPYSIFLRLRDCVDLPMRINRYLPVPMTPRQSRYINELRDEFSLSIPEESFDFKYIFPIIMKQRQIASGFIYIPGKKTKVFDTNKLAALNAVLEEIDAKKRVIWCSFQEEANQIISCVPESHTVSVLSTNTDHENTSALSRFRDDKNILNLITTYDILESGETLTSAQYAIHYSCPWSNAVYRNAKHRIFRKGAEIHDKIIYIHIFVRDSIEEIILQTLQKKMNMQTKLKSYIKEWLR